MSNERPISAVRPVWGVAFLMAAASGLGAANLFKDITTTDINTVANWSTSASAATPDPLAFGTGDTLWFNQMFAATSGTNYTASLSADLSVGALRSDYGDGTTGVAFGNVTISGAYTLTLNGSADYATNLPTGYTDASLVLNSGTGGSLTIDSNVLIADKQAWVTSRAVTVNGAVDLGSQVLGINTAGTGSVTFNGVLSGAGSVWKGLGTGTVTLGNVANTYTGANSAVVGGTLRFAALTSGADSFGNQTGVDRLIALNGANLEYFGTSAVTFGSSTRTIELRAGAGIYNNSSSGTVTIGADGFAQGGTASARTLTLGGTNTGENLFQAVLANSGANPVILTKAGTGTWILTAAATATGATTIGQGILRVTGSGVLPGASGSTSDSNNIVFNTGNTGGALEFETAAQLGAASQIRFRNTSGGAGNGGRLRYIGTTDQTVSKTIMCDTSVGIRIESDSVGGKLVLNGAFSQTSRPIYLGGTGTGLNELGIVFAGTGALTKLGSGTWLLSAVNTYTGGTFVNAGTLRVNALTGLGGAANALTIANGATFQYAGTGANTRSSNLSVTSSGIFDVVSSTGSVNWTGTGGTRTGAFTKTGLGSLTLAGAFTGGASVSVNNGTLTLTSANTHTGGTNISGGTLIISGAGTLGSGAITISSGGTLNLNSATITAPIYLAGGSLTNFGNYTGTLYADGDNSLSGNFKGILVNNGNLTASSGLTITNSLQGTGTLIGNVNVNGGAHSPGNSPGVQTIQGDLTYSGANPTIQWELTGHSAAPGNAGIVFDQIVVTGNLSFSTATALNLVFNLGGSTVDWNSAFWTASRSWLLFDVSGTTSSFGNLSLTDGLAYPVDGVVTVSNDLDSNGVALSTVRPDAGFYLGMDGEDVRLFYRPIPEPSTYGLVLGGLALAGAALRRRRAKRA